MYSRQGKEGDGKDTEAGSNGLSYPSLRNFVSVADCGDSHLQKESGSSLYSCQHHHKMTVEIQ